MSSAITHMSDETILAIADFFALSVTPALMVTLVFAVVYLLVGIPIHLWRGAAARDAWGSIAGLFVGLIYITFIFGIYPHLHNDAHLVNPETRVHQKVLAK